MSTIILDIRHRVPSGISTYAVGLAKEVAAHLFELGDEVYVLAERHQADAVQGLGKEVIVAPVREQFAHFSDDILEKLAWLQPTHVHSFGPLIDPRWSQSWSFTQHDLVRESATGLQYSNREILTRFGRAELDRLLRFVMWCRARGLSTNSSESIADNAHHQVLHCLRLLGQRRAAFVATLSKSVVCDLRSRWQLDPTRIVLAPPILQTLPLAPSPKGPSNEFLLFVGTPDEHKRLDVVCDWLDVDQNPLPVFVVGDNEVGPLGARLQAHPTHLALERPRVVRLGRVTPHELADLYTRALALVIASTAEGFCMPALECAKLGGRIVANDM